MNINADFGRRASAHAATMSWVPSPMAGVERKMLDRIGDEVARATSIVRYAPGSHFAPHVHPGGEEFLVLEGVFQDEHGDYPAGSYVRNPPTSAHTPGSEPGCTILVKLWQFDPDDRTEVKRPCDESRFEDAPGRHGIRVATLHRDTSEDVRLERWAPGVDIDMALPGGAEIFVLDGGFSEGGEDFGRHGWLRLPAATRLQARADDRGSEVWIKTGHLAAPQRAP